MVRYHPDPWRLPESEWWNHDGGYDHNLELRSKNIRGRKNLFAGLEILKQLLVQKILTK
jgi:hypothetical protein